MSIPKSKPDTHQQVLVSDCDSIRPLQKGEVWISRQGQGHILRPAPWPGVRQFVPDGQHPGLPSVLPLSNTVPSHGALRMSALKQPHLASQVPRIPPDSYSGSDEEYGVDPLELSPRIPPDSEPSSSDEEHGVNTLEPSVLDNSHRGVPTSYELFGLDSLSSNKPPEVGSPPGKRQWPFAGNMPPANLMRLNHSTLPMSQPPQLPQLPKRSPVQTFDADAIRRCLVDSLKPQKSTPKAQAPVLPERRRHLVDTPAMPRALSEEPVYLGPSEFVRAVQELPLDGHQGTLHALARRNSYEKMVEFAERLSDTQTRTLLYQLQKWIAAPDLLDRNPKAVPLMGLLLVFALYTPSLEELDEFMKNLPLTWPPALEHLRRACLDRRAALYPSRQREAFHARLNERYGD